MINVAFGIDIYSNTQKALTQQFASSPKIAVLFSPLLETFSVHTFSQLVWAATTATSGIVELLVQESLTCVLKLEVRTLRGLREISGDHKMIMT